MGTRLDLHHVLVGVLGSSNVYFQPPSTVKMTYPCIVYQRSPDDVKFANNEAYILVKRYDLTLIDKNPDTEIPDKLSRLRMCKMTRTYTADNLNHYAFTIYY